MSCTWEDPAVGAYRACQLCDHRHLGGGECAHPEAVTRGRTMPTYIARSAGGFCGPEAKHLTFPACNPCNPSRE